VRDSVQRALGHQSFAEGGKVIDVAGVAADGAFEIGDGEVPLLLAELRNAEKVTDRGDLGRAVDGLVKQPQSVRGAAVLEVARSFGDSVGHGELTHGTIGFFETHYACHAGEERQTAFREAMVKLKELLGGAAVNKTFGNGEASGN
jgi:hypothetical protein